MTDVAVRFHVMIAWDSVNRAEEIEWLEGILTLMQEETAAEVDDHSRWLRDLRKDTDNFNDVRFMVRTLMEGFVVESPDDGGDLDQALLFLASFRERWRPMQAFRVEWRSENTKGRGYRGESLVGPAGVVAMGRSYVRGRNAARKERG